ncbi:hypothetical protein ONA91_17720 [Micromonospora sp. DR5-3]|uniref:DUF2231 domain-containing protein n=1 Tax=unclassified Micromonospora TaxID=2617518 RepID=UPI0011D4E9BD|nr:MULTISPECIES: DUF2231 domain-containing protein [unclassified Micromonospora]MCW3816286.1 hypothetical protein [Micromonospora sp. DR5-3]TYC23983.1 hypothetical protein FXF52_12770 [Micromonospora sp. MP36]
MFKEINGLPGHVLIVHAVVVFVPLLALLASAYGLLPRWRSRFGWAVAVLAVVTPIATWLATESGEAFEEVQRERGAGGEFLDKIHQHSEYGDNLLWFVLGLAVAALLLLLVTGGYPRARSLPRWLAPVLTGVVVVLAVFALVYVYLTGDSGAQLVWSGQV